MTRFLINLFLLIPLCGCLMAQSQPDVELMTDQEISARVAGLGKTYKLDSAALAAFDKIITYDREVYLGKIYNITFSEVRFIAPPAHKMTSVAKSRISQILYADGRRDLFIALDDRTVKEKGLVDTSRIIVKNQKEWMKVVITEDPSTVNNLAEIGLLKASYEADMGNADNEDLMRGAGVILKKKAVQIKARYVLIETKFFKKSYGELPRVEVTARAFN